MQNIDAIASGVNGSLRKSAKDDEATTIVALASVLKNCAATYCGAVKNSEETYEEMAFFVLDRFGIYGINEIELAFSLAAANEFGDSADLKSYYGQFSVAALGDVLSAYREYRNKVVAELRLMQSSLELAAPKPAFDLEKFVQDRLASLLSRDNITVKDFTKFDYDVFVDTTKLCLLPRAECLQIWDESVAAVNRSLLNEALRDKKARRLINWIENPEFTERRQDWSRAEVLRRWFTGLRELALLIERNAPQKEILEHQGPEVAQA